MPKKENQEFVSKQYRGEVLHAMSYLEMLINMFISSYFCSGDIKKAEQMILYILGDDRTNLGAKTQMIQQIGINHLKSWWDSYKSPRKPDKGKSPYKMSSDFQFVVEERNVFAHRIVDEIDLVNNYVFNTKPITFLRFKNDIQGIEYTSQSFDLLIKTIYSLGAHMIKVIEKSDFLKSTLPPSD